MSELNMPNKPEEDFDKSYRLVNRDFSDKEYSIFLEAIIEETEEVVIHTEGSGDFKDLFSGFVKGLFYTVKDRNFQSFSKGFENQNVEYSETSQDIVQKLIDLASNVQEFEGRHKMYFDNSVSELSELIGELDSLEKDTITCIQVLGEGIYMESYPRSHTANQKIYLDKDQEEIVEKINEKLPGDTELVLTTRKQK